MEDYQGKKRESEREDWFYPWKQLHAAYGRDKARAILLPVTRPWWPMLLRFPRYPWPLEYRNDAERDFDRKVVVIRPVSSGCSFPVIYYRCHTSVILLHWPLIARPALRPGPYWCSYILVLLRFINCLQTGNECRYTDICTFTISYAICKIFWRSVFRVLC